MKSLKQSDSIDAGHQMYGSSISVTHNVDVIFSYEKTIQDN